MQVLCMSNTVAETSIDIFLSGIKSMVDSLCKMLLDSSQCCKIYLIQNISELGSTSVIVSIELERNISSTVLILMFSDFYKLPVWFQLTLHKQSDKCYPVFCFLEFINSLSPDTRISPHFTHTISYSEIPKEHKHCSAHVQSLF
jgi:hypothetical protein